MFSPSAPPTRWFASLPTGVVYVLLLLIAVAPLGLVHAMLVPLGHVPDEPLHAMRADSLAHGELAGRRLPVPLPGGIVPLSFVDADTMLVAVMRQQPSGAEGALTARDLGIADLSAWSHVRAPVAIGVPGTYFPVFNLPAALVMAAAPPLGMVPARAAHAARLLDLGITLLIGAVALLVARRGHALFLCLLALPMTVSLAASLNIDGLLIATNVLAASLLTRGGSRAAWRGAAAALFCVCLAKPPFLPLLMVLPFLNPGGPWRARAGIVTGLVALVLAWSLHVVRNVAGNVERAPYPAGPWWPGPPGQVFISTDSTAQLAVLLAHPARIVDLAAGAIDLASLEASMIGVLGRLDLFLPAFLYPLWLAAAAIAVLSEMGGHDRHSPKPRPLLILLALAASYVLICVSTYLTWTPVGADHLAGMQGRYLLPLVPFLALALPRFRLPGGGTLHAAGMLAPTIAAIAGAITLPMVFLSAYYLR